MPYYQFVARNEDSQTENLGTIALLDDADARSFAKGVIRDLIHAHPAFCRNWTIDIAEDERAVSSVPFAETA
jgi:hypothetical protein